jgi:hypothetical protein
MTPIYGGAALFNKEEQSLDLHFHMFKYKTEYLKSVMGFAGSNEDIELELEQKQFAFECLYPAMMKDLGGKKGQGSRVSRHYSPLKSSKIGVTRLAMKEVRNVFQVGTDITFVKPLYVIVQGKNAQDEDVEHVIQVNSQGVMRLCTQSGSSLA